MEVITKKYYADIVDSWIGKGNIIAIVGVRRVGKSYVVKDFIQKKYPQVTVDDAALRSMKERGYYGLSLLSLF